MTPTEIGNIVFAAVGAEACMAGYDTTSPWMVGILAVQYGDANPDGTLN